jgi:hypothetical protein
MSLYLFTSNLWIGLILQISRRLPGLILPRDEISVKRTFHKPSFLNLFLVVRELLALVMPFHVVLKRFEVYTIAYFSCIILHCSRSRRAWQVVWTPPTPALHQLLFIIPLFFLVLNQDIKLYQERPFDILPQVRNSFNNSGSGSEDCNHERKGTISWID